ncbi:MAG: S41 family peptidase, partial [Gemmataceae bacterium]
MPNLRMLLLALLAAAPAVAQEPIRFGRTPDISPDGKAVAFSYLGDLFTVEAIGGVARPLTAHPAHDVNPAFSPDGQHVAFSSNRHGGYDVFVVPARGGKPRRLTFDSASDMVCGWTRDGGAVLFASSRGVGFPQGFELYTVPLNGGRVARVGAPEAKDGAFSPAGDRLAYVRGPGAWYRKNYRGSSNDDVWLANADGSGSQRLTSFNGQDHSPMWSADGSSLFYVSEVAGAANVVRQPAVPGATAVPVTAHADESVRRARISRNGEYIVYECGLDLWVVGTKDGCKPRKLAIEVNSDDKANNERVTTFTRGMTEFAVTADEKFVAFSLQGKLFRTAVGSATGKPVQMTTGPAMDHGISWAADASKIAFLSDRSGHEDVYLLEANDPEHPKLTEAHAFKVTRLTDTKDPESGLSFSPDGKKVAFLRGGKLFTMNPDGKDLKEVVKDVQVFDYEWSPDGRWFAYARRDGSFASELYIVPAGGPTDKDPARNVTRHATFNAGVTWSQNGKRLAFVSERRGISNLIHVLDLEKPAAPGAAPAPAATASTLSAIAWGTRPPLPIDFEDIHERVSSVRAFGDGPVISPDATKVAFRDPITRDLFVATTSGGSLTRITTGGLNPRQIVWSKRRPLIGPGVELIYFLDGDGNLRLASGTGTEARAGSTTASGNAPVLPWRARVTVNTQEMHQEMFDQGWRFLSDNFYDEKYHGSNWDEVRGRYRPAVKHVEMKEDLYALMYLMMGELNASHLGVVGPPSAGPEEPTAELGLLWDEGYRGKGLKVAEILKRGPADQKGIGIKPGEYVVGIDGTEVTDGANVSRLLNGKVGEAVVVQVTDSPNDPKAKRRRVELTGASRAAVSERMYDRWVARNAAKVSELSKNKLGYIHIPSMDEEGLEKFVRSLYSDNYDKDAIVLDVRYNGGGFTHDQVLNYLGSKEHTVFKMRDGGSGLVLRSGDRKWHKPLALLINNQSYSDAEIFPSAFKTLGLGKLVGEPTGGFVIGTSPLRLVDGSMFRVPRIGVYTLGGVNMDKKGVEPDVLVERHPDQLAKGQDAQLEKAVEVLTADVIAWRRKR